MKLTASIVSVYLGLIFKEHLLNVIIRILACSLFLVIGGISIVMGDRNDVIMVYMHVILGVVSVVVSGVYTLLKKMHASVSPYVLSLPVTVADWRLFDILFVLVFYAVLISPFLLYMLLYRYLLTWQVILALSIQIINLLMLYFSHNYFRKNSALASILINSFLTAFSIVYLS